MSINSNKIRNGMCDNNIYQHNSYFISFDRSQYQLINHRRQTPLDLKIIYNCGRFLFSCLSPILLYLTLFSWFSYLSLVTLSITSIQFIFLHMDTNIYGLYIMTYFDQNYYYTERYQPV